MCKKEQKLNLSNNIWWTRKARIQAEKRLLSNAKQAGFILFWYSLCAVGSSIYYLSCKNDSPESGVAWIIFSVLTLCLSCLTTSFTFSSRAMRMKDCYIKLGELYHRSRIEDCDIAQINDDYKRILELCENHTDIDNNKALCLEFWNTSEDKRNTLSKVPTSFNKFNFFSELFYRFFFLFLCYFVPVIIFLLLECNK